MTFLVSPIVNKDDDGKVFLTNSAKYVDDYYFMLKEQRLLEYAFFDGSAKTETDFAKTIVNPMVIFAFIYDDPNGFPVGHVHLTNVVGYCAMGHFCILRDYHKYSIEIAKDSIEGVFSLKRTDGSPFLLNILGITPVSNKAAINFIQKIGFKPLCTLRKACMMFYKNKYEDGLLTRLENNQY